MRQLAWLIAVPRGSKSSRMEQLDILSDEPEYNFPELTRGEYFVNLWRDMGEAVIAKDGLEPLSWPDMKAWAELSGLELEIGDYEAVMKLSKAYTAQYYASIEKDCLSPVVPYNPETVASKFEALFSMLRKPK